jgi:hypothetical protein
MFGAAVTSAKIEPPTPLLPNPVKTKIQEKTMAQDTGLACIRQQERPVF